MTRSPSAMILTLACILNLQRTARATNTAPASSPRPVDGPSKTRERPRRCPQCIGNDAPRPVDGPSKPRERPDAPPPAQLNRCARHVRVGGFLQANPCAVAITGWLSDNATCWSFYRVPTGAHAMAHLEAGELDLAFVGTAPFAAAVARGARTTAVAVAGRNRGSEALVVREDIRTIQDLRGAVVATPRGSTAHVVLLAAMGAGALGMGQVRVLFLAPEDLTRAWDAGTVDGVACWGQCLAHALQTPRGGGDGAPGHVLVDAAATAHWGYETATLIAADDDFLRKETELVDLLVRKCMRANYDYVNRGPASAAESAWDVGGAYLDIVERFVMIEAWSQVYAESDLAASVAKDLAGQEYSSIEEQLAYPDDGGSLRRQAILLYLWKVLAVDPRRLGDKFFATKVDAASLMRAAATEAVPLDDPSDPLPLNQTKVVQSFFLNETCANFTTVSLTNNNKTFALNDGSRSANAYVPDVQCVWAIRAPDTGCVALDLTFLATEAPLDRVDVFGADGDLLGRFSGRSGLGSRSKPYPRVAGCELEEGRDAVPDAWRPADGGNAALYVRWRTDAFDERVIGTPPRVGFAATASAVASAGRGRCPPGFGGASCDCPECLGVVDAVGERGIIRSHAPEVAERGAPYGAYAKCGWRIRLGDAARIVLDVASLGIEDIQDQVRVYAGAAPPGGGWRAERDVNAISLNKHLLMLTGSAAPAAPFYFESDVFVTFETDGLANCPSPEPEWSLVGDDTCPVGLDGRTTPGFEIKWSRDYQKDLCPATPCGPRGACVGGRCRCDLGWYGATCEQDRCFGAVLLEPAATGRFASGAAADYAPMTMCTWAATAPPGVDAARLEGVMLRFLDFDLEAFGATSGTTDVLQLYATRADDPTDLEGATLVATFSALSVAALRAGDDDLDAAARPGIGVWVDGAGNFVQTFETGETLEITTRDPDADRPIRGLAAVMRTDAANPEPHRGIDVEWALLWSDRTFCDGINGRWPCPEGLACEGNVCVVPDTKSGNRHRRARRQRNAILIGFGAAIGAALLAVAAWRAWVFGREKRSLEDDRSRLVRNQIEDARGQMKDFHAPFCCLPGDAFAAAGALRPHETLRNDGQLVYYDAVEAVRDARRQGLVFVFISHQWLDFARPDPDNAHFVASTRALASVAAAENVGLDRLRVWIDYLSIPQSNERAQKLAVSSLPTFASCVDYFCVVAPDATHRGTGLGVNSRSFRSRAWCRAEMMACWARNGPKDMYLSTKRGLVPLFKGPDDPLLIEAIAVFDGDLSCCGAEHPDKGACDRELLMSPMLGLFYEIYRDRDGALRDAWAVVAPRADELYPRTFTWATAGGGPPREHVLFGDLVAAARVAADVERGGGEVTAAALRGFAPGTTNQPRAHGPRGAKPPSPLGAIATLKRAMSTTLSKSSPMQPATQRSLSTTSRRSSNRSSFRSTIASLPAGRSPGEETRSSGSLRDSLEAQPTWGNRLNSSTDSSGAIAPGSGTIARPRSNLEPRLPHPSSP